MINTEKSDAGIANSVKGLILIIEDDKFLRDILVNKFEEGGFEVNAATNGEDAFKMIGIRKPGIIILDLLMPKMDGFQVMERLRSDPNNADIPVLILSNLMEKGDIDKAMSLGVSNYMVKATSTPEEVVARAEAMISRKP